MNITQLLLTYSLLSGEQDNNINDYVARALLHVVHSHIMTVTPSFVLTLCCRNNHTINLYNQVLSILFQGWGLYPLQIVNVVYGQSGQFVPGRRHYNLIFTDSYAAFAEIKVESYTPNYNYNEVYYIFLQARDHLLWHEMELIFEHCWHHQLINCNVQVQKANGDILVYTYFPFGSGNCLNMTPQLINRFNGTHMHHPQLFPRKLGNFFGCPLRVVNPELTPYLGTDVLEDNLLRALAKKLNFSVEFIQPSGHKSLSTRALQMLENVEADMCLGGIFQTVERRVLTTSTHNYLETSLRFGVLDISYQLNSLDILLFPYPSSIWLLISLMLAIVAIVQLLMERVLPSNHLRSLAVHWLNLVLIILGQPMLTGHMPRSSGKRLFCIFVMLFTLVIRTVYQGMLFHLIRTHQLNRIPQSIVDLLDYNYIVVLSTDMVKIFSDISMMQQLRYRLLSDSSYIVNYMLEHAQDRQLVTIAASDVFRNYNRLQDMHKAETILETACRFEIIPQDIMYVQLTISLRKHSFLIDEFNEQILWMRSAGLILIWMGWDLRDGSTRAEQLESYKMFGVKELQFLFLLLSSGLLMSLLLFGLELLSFRSARLQIWLQSISS